MLRPSDRDVNWMPPVQGESPPVQVKEPYGNLDMVTCRLSSCNLECTKYTIAPDKAVYCVFTQFRGPENAITRALDFFQDWWAEVTHGAKIGGSFSEMMGQSISNQTQLTFG